MLNRYRSATLAVAIAAALGGADAAADTGDTGGIAPPGPPKIDAVSCLSSTTCRSRSTVVRGQELVIRGRNLGSVARVVFGGTRGRGDDVAATVTRATKSSAVATVPSGARSGPVVLQDARRSPLARVARVTVKPAPKLDIAPGSTFFYRGRRRPDYEFTVTSATTVGVELTNEETQAVVRSWQVDAQPGVPARVRWNGKAAGGSVAPPGQYRFRLATGASSAAMPAPESVESFFYADHLFPIRGKHDLGQTPTNGFGGGGQRPHFGQDMFAACGTKLAAARGGTVQFAGYHSAAGNYLVIDGGGTDRDYVYMHMIEPALVKTGERVFTGQKVGEVGETGRASGCHLHFELWSGPGWYEGGKAIDPLPSLRTWDAFS